jgi:hypothetical protein
MRAGLAFFLLVTAVLCGLGVSGQRCGVVRGFLEAGASVHELTFLQLAAEARGPKCTTVLDQNGCNSCFPYRQSDGSIICVHVVCHRVKGSCQCTELTPESARICGSGELLVDGNSADVLGVISDAFSVEHEAGGGNYAAENKQKLETIHMNLCRGASDVQCWVVQPNSIGSNQHVGTVGSDDDAPSRGSSAAGSTKGGYSKGGYSEGGNYNENNLPAGLSLVESGKPAAAKAKKSPAAAPSYSKQLQAATANAPAPKVVGNNLEFHHCVNVKKQKKVDTLCGIYRAKRTSARAKAALTRHARKLAAAKKSKSKKAPAKTKTKKPATAGKKPQAASSKSAKGGAKSQHAALAAYHKKAAAKARAKGNHATALEHDQRAAKHGAICHDGTGKVVSCP